MLGFPSKTSLLMSGLSLLLASCGGLPKRNLPKTVVSARTSVPRLQGGIGPRFQDTEFLTFAELKSLAADPTPGGELEKKLERFFNRPIISNEAWFQGKRPTRGQNESMGEFLRVATWNVEKSLRTREVAEMFRSKAAFERMIDPTKAPKGSPDHAALLAEYDRLVTADVVFLQESDIGVTRSGYRNSAREIAQALGMNYVYAPQQLEIDPIVLGMEPGADGKMQHPDPGKYKGVFGLAVLSKYPIQAAKCFQLLAKPYDWYEGEKKKIHLMEDARRLAAGVLFENKTYREIKVGGRIFFRVDLTVPGLPNDTLSLIHNHLEIKATAKNREEQLAEILKQIREIPHTVIMAGDFNSSSQDMSPTSTFRVLHRTSTDPQTWLGVGLNLVMQAATVANASRALVNHAKNLHDPLAPNIPIVFPNKKRKLITDVRDFRFSDGGCFDFRGDRDRSINRSTATLANSNQRAFKGLTPTFRVQRPIGPFGRGRLDWIFVKAPPSTQTRGHPSYRLAPHFGETLSRISGDLKIRLSDHCPCVVDIPLQEPPGLE
jgi:endonuclease/exonuclease/phosphatase family metal-dependent hydrolase